jgi:negative regulator of flagellin synthesis FlgM
MMDGIGKSGPGRLELVRGSVERSASTAKASDAPVQRQAGSASSIVADIMSAGAPVDAGKVAAIRAAIAEGRYPVDPAKIAQSMLALDLPAKGNA